MKKLQLILLLLIGFTYEINYTIQGVKYSTELQLYKYEDPQKIKGMYLQYLDRAECTRPDSIWVNVK